MSDDHYQQDFSEPWEVHPDVDTPINDLDTDEEFNYGEVPF